MSGSRERPNVIDLGRNHLIEAGAGTGKTYALVQALLQALFQKRVPMEQLVALTFTKKAAGEMKERVAHELHQLSTVTTLPALYQSMGLSLENLQSIG